MKSKSIFRVTLLVSLLAFLFVLFFQVNKTGPFRQANPFLEDPYDAVGSFAAQGAVLVAALTCARGLRFLQDPSQASKTRLILRGDLLVLAAILLTLIGDAIAALTRPLAPSLWGTVLEVELVLMFLLTFLGGLALALVFTPQQIPSPPSGLTPADAIDDLWTLVRFTVGRMRRFLPWAWIRWVNDFNSDRLFMRLPTVNPRSHPWRFACVLGLLAGISLALVQLQEGLAPNWRIGLLLAGIFISGEFVMTLLGFALLGGFLGLRPPILPAASQLKH